MEFDRVVEKNLLVWISVIDADGFKGVESQLAALGAQKKKQERAVMLLQRESKKCEELQEGLAQLKRQKVG